MASDQYREEQDFYFHDVGPNLLNPEMNPNVHYVFKLSYKPNVSLFNHTLPTSAQSEIK